MSNRTMLFLCPLLFALAQAGPEQAALHATVKAEFAFQVSTRSTETEYWISPEKSVTKRGDRIAPVPERPASRQSTPEDMRTAQFDYPAEFIWQVKDTGETRPILGRACSLTVATGIAEFAETTVKLWFCPEAGAGERALGEVLGRTVTRPYDGIAAFLSAEADRRTGVALLAAEASTEAAISPVMVQKFEVIKLERTPLP